MRALRLKAGRHPRQRSRRHLPVLLLRRTGRQQKRTTCMLSYRPLVWVEEQIEAKYQDVQLFAEGIEQTGRDIVAALADEQTAVEAERERQNTRLRQLNDERTKLLHAHYAGAVPLDLLKAEQQRISLEIAVAQSRLDGAQANLTRVETTVTLAVEKATDCHRAYLAAGAHERRLFNQGLLPTGLGHRRRRHRLGLQRTLRHPHVSPWCDRASHPERGGEPRQWHRSRARQRREPQTTRAWGSHTFRFESGTAGGEGGI